MNEKLQVYQLESCEQAWGSPAVPMLKDFLDGKYASTLDTMPIWPSEDAADIADAQIGTKYKVKPAVAQDFKLCRIIAGHQVGPRPGDHFSQYSQFILSISFVCCIRSVYSLHCDCIVTFCTCTVARTMSFRGLGLTTSG